MFHSAGSEHLISALQNTFELMHHQQQPFTISRTKLNFINLKAGKIVCEKGARNVH